MSILTDIFSHKRSEVEQHLKKCSLTAIRRAAETARPTLDFIGKLRQPPEPALIAEIKHASPSKGILLKDFDPLRLARIFTENGARAISILTDEQYFQGCLDDLAMVRRQFPSIPLLRKDFIFHPYQVYEARAAGADAILFIVAGLDPAQLAELHQQARELGLAALVEVHNRSELEQALLIHPELIGINNRDLQTFDTNLGVTFELCQLVPRDVTLVAESGIQTSRDVGRLVLAGVHAILVGEALVTAADIAVKTRQLAYATDLSTKTAYEPDLPGEVKRE